MPEEYYHKDIFGNVVDLDFIVAEEDEDLVGPKGKSDFNIFAFTDAVGARDKKKAWILYQRALASGLAPEEVFYKLVWQVKTLILASKTQSAEEAGMKAFPYMKARGNLKNFRTSELQDLSTDLVTGYHLARRGEGEIETLVEKILLNL